MEQTLDRISQAELLAIRRRKADLLYRRIQLLKATGGMGRYRPHEKQDAFHRAGIHYRRRMARAGNRFGKSTLGCAEDCGWLKGERVWYPLTDPARTGGIPTPPNKGLVITQDWDLVDSIFTSQRGDEGKIWRMLPQDGFVKGWKRNHSGVIDTIECANGSLLKFDTVKSWKANPQGTESADWDFIHVDEPCPEKMYKAAARGLMDRRGASWFTLTPLTEFWINDMFFPEDTGGKSRDDVFAVDGSTYDNPYLSREAIADFEKELDDDEKQCRIHGVPLHLSGLVYKEFRWDKHVLTTLPRGWNAWESPPVTWPIYYAIDPHPRTPHAVLFCTVDPFGTRYYYFDIFQHCMTRELATQVKSVFKSPKDEKRLRQIMWGKLDPLGYVEDPNDGGTMALEFERYGLSLEKAVKDLTGGILKVKQSLKEESLRFTPAAARTLWEIQRYAWQEDKEKPVDKDDHMMENLYRLELSEPRWVDYVDQSNIKIDVIGDKEITEVSLNLGDISFAT